MAKINISTKRVAISKAQSQMVAIVSAASFVTVFCLVASHAVLSQNQYTARIISAKEKANDQLQKDIDAYDDLVKSYKKFETASTNIIGGSRSGTGQNDGRNSKLVLDSLPNEYDFPALTSTIEKILDGQSLKISGVSGTDDQLNQEANSKSPTPTPVVMPFSFSVAEANYQSIQDLIGKLQTSIRPIQIDTLDLSGGVNNMTLNVSAHTYFQPSKSLDITKKVVK